MNRQPRGQLRAFLAVAVSTVGALTAAHAASAGEAAAPEQPVAAAQPANEKADSLAEVVVTAEKRSSNLQDTPITVNAISGDSLK